MTFSFGQTPEPVEPKLWQPFDGREWQLLADSVENSRPWFPPLKSTRRRLKSLLSAEVSRHRFHAAECKKDVFTG